MSNSQTQLIQKLWNYCNILRDDGLSYGDYVEQLTFLLFLKMADEQRRPPFHKKSPIPEKYSWPELLKRDGDELEIHYRHILEELGKEPGLIGVIFRKAQNKIQDPAKLRRLIADLIDKEEWSSLDTDVKGDAYEGLLQKNAEDVKGGAGQYFTPRPLIRAIVDVMQPQPGETICDPACGTGGFLLIAHEFIRNRNKLDKKQLTFLNTEQLRGVELVDSVARLCCMNLVLHGIGSDATHVPVMVKDALAGKHGEYEMVLTNPPFGKKSSVTIVNEAGEKRNNRSSCIATISGQARATNSSISSSTSSLSSSSTAAPRSLFPTMSCSKAARAKRFAASYSNKPMSTPASPADRHLLRARRQGQRPLLRPQTSSRKAVDRQALDLRPAHQHTFHPQRKSPQARETSTTSSRATIRRTVHERKETERFKSFTYEELTKRDKLNLDIFWLKDETLEDSANLPDPDVIAAEIVEDLQAALAQFAEIASDLKK